MRTSIPVAVVVLALSCSPAFAQKTATSHKPAAVSADTRFIEEAANGGLAEVELGKLAANKASSDDVRKFAQRMVDDHGKANDELKTMAGRKNVSWPTELNTQNKATYDRSPHSFQLTA